MANGNSTLRKDAQGEEIQAADLTSAVTQSVSVGVASAATAAVVNASLIMVQTSVYCFIAVGATATTAGVPIYPGIPYYFTMTPGNKLAAITASGSGTLTVTAF